MTVPKRVTIVTAITASCSAIFLRGQLRYLKQAGFAPVLVSSSGPEVRALAASEGVRLFEIRMEREPSPIRDCFALCRLLALFLWLRPEVVNAGTPKAGFLCTLAAWLCRVPVRIYTLHGFRHESMVGIRQRFMMSCERLVCRLCHCVICVSPSLKERGVADNIIPATKGVVLGSGSCGVNLEPFVSASFSQNDRRLLRQALGISEGALVVGFVGRLIPRKGVTELIEAWGVLRNQFPEAVLLLVGPYEDAQPLAPSVHRAIEADDRVVTTGPVRDVARVMAIMDVFTLPAHWEGFGNVLVEAAAMGVPVVTTDGTGTRDAVADDVNGMIIPTRRVDPLVSALSRYMRSHKLRHQHGSNGIEWARKFQRERIWDELQRLYAALIEERRIRWPSSRPTEVAHADHRE